MWLNIKQAEEEVRELQKKMQQLENDLDQTQEKLMNANQRLEEKEKALQNVSHQDILTMITNCHFFLFSYSNHAKKPTKTGQIVVN